jgi:mRNA interferase YafQ
MYEIKRGKKFRKSFKRVVHSRDFDANEFENVIQYLIDGKELPEKYHDHALSGDMRGIRECHLASDLLLTYEIDEENKTVRLANIGNHANIFG